MKKSYRLWSIALAICMLLQLAMPTFASGVSAKSGEKNGVLYFSESKDKPLLSSAKNSLKDEFRTKDERKLALAFFVQKSGQESRQNSNLNADKSLNDEVNFVIKYSTYESEIEKIEYEDSRAAFYMPEDTCLSEKSKQILSDLGFLYYDPAAGELNPTAEEDKKTEKPGDYRQDLYLLPKERKKFILDTLISYINKPEIYESLIKKANEKDGDKKLSPEEKKILFILENFQISKSRVKVDNQESNSSQAGPDIQDKGGLKNKADAAENKQGKGLIPTFLSKLFSRQGISPDQAESKQGQEDNNSLEKSNVEVEGALQNTETPAENISPASSEEDVKYENYYEIKILLSLSKSDTDLNKEEKAKTNEVLDQDKKLKEEKKPDLILAIKDYQADLSKTSGPLTEEQVKDSEFQPIVQPLTKEADGQGGVENHNISKEEKDALKVLKDLRAAVKNIGSAGKAVSDNNNLDKDLEKSKDSSFAEKSNIDLLGEENSISREGEIEIANEEAPQELRAASVTATIYINTVDEKGNKLYFGDNLGGTVRDPNLNHDATYALYKLENDGKYHPLQIYQKPVKEGETPILVNWKHGNKGVVTLDNIPQGDYLVKEVKSVFQYAFKNTAFKFSVSNIGSITKAGYLPVDIKKADYEVTTFESETKTPLTYNQKMDLDNQRIIGPEEITVKNENLNITKPDDFRPAATSNSATIDAIYHKGSFTVRKVDEDGNPVEGAVFELHGHDEHRKLRIYTVKTDAKGYATFFNINVPSYHLLREVSAPSGFAMPNYQYMIYVGEGTWVEFDSNHKPKLEHIPLQISDNKITAYPVELKPIVPLNPQETRQNIQNDKYRSLIDGVTGASIAPKNWFQYLGLQDGFNVQVPKSDDAGAEDFWKTNWNDPTSIVYTDPDNNYETNFYNTKRELFFDKQIQLKTSNGSYYPVNNEASVEFPSIEWVNKKGAALEINKRGRDKNLADQDMGPLSGAVFNIFKIEKDSNGAEVFIPVKEGLSDKKAMSNPDGLAVFEGLTYGNYMIRETRTPGGYDSIPDDSIRVSVDKNSNIKVIAGTNSLEDIIAPEIKSSTKYKFTSFDANGWPNIDLQRVSASTGTKIINVDSANGTFTQIVYVNTHTVDDNRYTTIGNLYKPKLLVQAYGDEGESASGNLGYTNAMVYYVNEDSSGNNPYPNDFNPDLTNSAIYQQGDNLNFNNNKILSLNLQAASNRRGLVIKLTGKYNPNASPIKNIDSKVTFSSPASPNYRQYVFRRDYEDDLEVSASHSVKPGQQVIEATNRAELFIYNDRNHNETLDHHGTLKLRKTIAGTDEILPGAKFGLYVGEYKDLSSASQPYLTGITGEALKEYGMGFLKDQNGNLINETDSNGNIIPGQYKSNMNVNPNLVFNGLTPGVYTLKEIDPPEGYEKSLYSWTVKVYDSGATVVTLNPYFNEDSTLEQPVDVSDKVHYVVNSLSSSVARDSNPQKGSSYWPKDTIYANEGEMLKVNFNIKVDQGVRRGGYFDIKLPEELNLNGINKVFSIDDISLNGYILLRGEYIENTHSIRYTFTDYVEGLVQPEIDFHMLYCVDKKNVKNDWQGKFNFLIAGDNVQVAYRGENNDQAPTDYKVNYDYDVAYRSYNNTVSGYRWFYEEFRKMLVTYSNGSRQWVNYDNTGSNMWGQSARIIGLPTLIDQENSYIDYSLYIDSLDLKDQNGNKLGDVINRYITLTNLEGVVGDVTNLKYQIYELPATASFAPSFGVEYDKLTPLADFTADRWANISKLNGDGTIVVSGSDVNKDLVVRIRIPYDMTENKFVMRVKLQSQVERSDISTDNKTIYLETRSLMPWIVTRDGRIIPQAQILSGEVMPYNVKQDLMSFDLFKRNDNNSENWKDTLIKKGQLVMTLERASEEYPELPDNMKEFTFTEEDLKSQGIIEILKDDQGNPVLDSNGQKITFIKVLSIKDIPQNINGEYILKEKAAPSGYIINGLSYRIRIDQKARKILLVGVTGADGLPAEYEHYNSSNQRILYNKKNEDGTVTNELTPDNPIELFKEVTNSSGFTAAEKLAMHVIDKNAEFPKAGGGGPYRYIMTGLSIMAIAYAFWAINENRKKRGKK